MAACTSACTGGRRGVAHDLHPAGEVVDKGVEREEREDRLGRLRGGEVFHAQEAAGTSLLGDAVGGKVGVRDHQHVAVTHGAQDVEHVGVEAVVEYP